MTEVNYTDILTAGKAKWNEWRSTNHRVRPDFSGQVLDGLNLEGYNLSNCNFYEASLKDCNLNNTELSWTAFFRCKLMNSTFINPAWTDYSKDIGLMGVNFRWSSFAKSDLQNAKMMGALFEGVHLHECNLKGADISYSRIHGLSAWGNNVDSTTIQNDLIITPFDEPTIKVDNFEIAQFLYLLISNSKITSIIDTLASKVVLILGSFGQNEKNVLAQIKKQLSYSNYVPVIFDFDKPATRNFTETVSTIAHFSKFIIADLTSPRSIAHELASLIPRLTSVPIVPIIMDNQPPYAMFQDFESYKHISKIITYQNNQSFANIVNEIITNANKILNTK